MIDHDKQVWTSVDGIVTTGGVQIRAAWTTLENGRVVLSGLQISGAPITSDLLRSIPIGRLANLPNAARAAVEQPVADLPPLGRQKGEAAEAFSDRVTEYYRIFSGLSSKPAKLISEHSKVPTPTVHGWIREARLRGKLPPGRKGKAG